MAGWAVCAIRWYGAVSSLVVGWELHCVVCRVGAPASSNTFTALTPSIVAAGIPLRRNDFGTPASSSRVGATSVTYTY